MAKKIIANVEDQEMIQLPGQSSFKVNGKTHASGGENMSLPEGTQIYSDRLKIGDKTMAERKEMRDKRLEQINKSFLKDKTDSILKNSLSRIKQSNDFEDEKDLAYQQAASDMIQGAVSDSIQQFATGTGPRGILPNLDYNNMSWDEITTGNDQSYGPDTNLSYMNKGGFVPGLSTVNPTQGMNRLDYAQQGMNPRNEFARIPGIDPTLEPLLPLSNIPSHSAPMTLEASKLTANALGMAEKGNKQQAAFDLANPKDTAAGMGFTPGDWIGMAGSAIGSVSQMMNTIQNAKATKPVVNHYEGFNEKALQKSREFQDQILYNKDRAGAEMQRQVQLEANSARARTSGQSSSMNTLRAMDAVTDSSVLNAKSSGQAQLESVFGQQMQQAKGTDIQLMSEKDKMEMAGRAAMDDANAANLDNFYSNFSKNIAGATEGIQKLGANINEAKHRDDFMKLLPQTNAWAAGFDKNMQMSTPKSMDKYTPTVQGITQTPIGDFNFGFDHLINQAIHQKLPENTFNTNRR